jgi:ATP-dependent helicase YprA (DUF1998 family)
MALVYEWTLLKHKKFNNPNLGLTEIVAHADWKVMGTDENGDSAEYISTVIWDPNQIKKNKFTPYDQITDEQILEWVKELVATQPERQIEQYIRNSIAEQAANY